MRQIYVAIDLEMNQPSDLIIQIGVCAGDILTGEIIATDSFYVNPGEPIVKYITDLTGITQEQIDQHGTPIEVAYDKLVSFCVKHGVQTHGRVITWGGDDVRCLREQLKIGREDARWIFGRRYKDTKTIFQAWRESQSQQLQGGLAKSMTKLGLKFEGRKHDGKSDAINTFRMYCALLKKFRA